MKILLTGAYSYTETQLAELRALGADIVFVRDEREKLDIDVSEIEAVVCNSLFLCNDISAFCKLKFIQVTSAGLDRLPLSYIEQHNIVLHNARGVYSVPMAEFAVLGALLLYKQSLSAHENQKKHIWKKNRSLLELTGRQVLIVGTGSVGIECAKRFSAFGTFVSGVDIIAEDRPFFEAVYPTESLEALLPSADIVVLTLPLTKETEGLFGKAFLSKMKNTAVLINISRGAVVNEADLICALSHKSIGGAVLDVFENEPLPETSPLWDLPNAVITPHTSFISDQTSARLFRLIYSNLKAFIKGEGNS